MLSNMHGRWPVTIVAARYSGVYEGGRWLAFFTEPWNVPECIYGGDDECSEYFHKPIAALIGAGDTPDEALELLRTQLVQYARDSLYSEYAQRLQPVDYDV